MLQTDVEVFGLVGLHAAQGHPRLPDELIMRQLVFVADGHPANERQRGEKMCVCRGKNKQSHKLMKCVNIQVGTPLPLAPWIDLIPIINNAAARLPS